MLDSAAGSPQTVASTLAAAGVKSEDELRAQIVSRMGWRIGESFTIKLRRLTVRLATQLQLKAAAQERARLHAAFECEAREQPPPGPGSQAAEASSVPSMLRRLWQIRWERDHKETLWRLAVDGIPLPGNAHLHGAQPGTCGCGGFGGEGPQPCPPGAHHFWDCPVAQAVVQQIAAHAPVPITRAHIWLAEAPTGLQQCVWDVVALAALTAMERARAGLRAATRHAGAQQDAAPAGAPHEEGQPPVEVAKARAVLELWQRLKGFAELGVPRRGWGGVGPDHPILSVVDGQLRCADPIGIEMGAVDPGE